MSSSPFSLPQRYITSLSSYLVIETYDMYRQEMEFNQPRRLSKRTLVLPLNIILCYHIFLLLRCTVERMSLPFAHCMLPSAQKQAPLKTILKDACGSNMRKRIRCLILAKRKTLFSWRTSCSSKLHFDMRFSTWLSVCNSDVFIFSLFREAARHGVLAGKKWAGYAHQVESELVYTITNHHLKGVEWVVTFSWESHKRGIAAVPLLSGGLFHPPTHTSPMHHNICV